MYEGSPWHAVNVLEDTIMFDHPDKIKSHLANTRSILNEAVYGHEAAKTQILSIIAREISNPSSMGNAIAIQGPMGNGKTTLVKEGICKAMKRPFALIALGGMTDSSFFDGHEYTYEGSRAGRIIEIISKEYDSEKSYLGVVTIYQDFALLWLVFSHT